MRKSLLALLSAAILIGLLALPAAAVDEGVAVITGALAEVGDNFDDFAACTKDDQPAPEGRGIGVPNPTDDPTLPPKVDDLDNKYRLQIPRGGALLPETFTAVIEDNEDKQELSVATGALSICGNVGPVGGQGMVPKLGPWCGMSKGYNGNGKIRFRDIDDGEVRWAQVSDVAWKFSAGGFLPILGKVRDQNTAPNGQDKGSKKSKWGTLVALVNARSAPGEVDMGQSCVDANNGGQDFRVDGVAAIIDPDNDGAKNDVYTWKDNGDGDKDRQDNPYFCKGSRDSNNDGTKDQKCPIYQAKTKGTKPKDNS